MAEEDGTAPRVPSDRRRALVLVTLAAVVALGAALLLSTDDWEREGPPLEVAGWAPYWQTHLAYLSFDPNADLFGDVSVFGFEVTGAGDLGSHPNLSIDATGRFAARAAPAGVVLLATIFDSTESGVMAALLADPARRAAHVQAIVALVETNGFDGVDIDYEQFAFADDRGTWDTTRPDWVAFIGELATEMHSRDKVLVVSVPSVDYSVYDHEAMGRLADRVKLMAYNFSTSEPGPIAPAGWVREEVDQLKDLVPAEKIDLGVPAYGYDWPVTVTGTCPPDQQPGRRSVTPAAAAQRAAETGATLLWDEEAEEARFDYTQTLTGVDASGVAVSCTVERTVRYLEARAIHRRAWIAHREDLHGVAIWALGNDDPSIWPALRTARDGAEEWPGATFPPVTTTVPPESTDAG